MRIKLLPSLLIAVTAITLLASCSQKTNKQGRYIPNDAIFAAHFNGASLNEKLPWEEVKTNKLFKLAQADSTLDAIAKTTLDNPENTGIDIKKDLVVFVNKDSAGGYAAFEGTVKDAAKFKTYYTSVLKNATASQKEGIDYLSKEKITVSWNKEMFVVVMDLPEMKEMNELQQNSLFDSTANTTTPAIAARNTVSTAESIYKIKEDKSLGKDERFSKMVNDNADMHFWLNIEALYKSMPGMEAMAMVNFTKMYEENRMASSVNFDNGKISAKFSSYTNKELAKIYKKYAGDNISADMATKLPAKEMAVYFAMNFKLQAIPEMVKLMGMDGLLNMAAGLMGFSMDDLVKAFKGDFQFAAYDFKTDSLGRTEPNVLFAATIGNKEAFGKIMAAAEKANKGAIENEKVQYNKNDQYFVLGNSKADNDQFLASKGGNKPAFWDKIKNGSIGGFVNLQILMKSIDREISTDSLGREALKISQAFWDNVYISGGKFDGNAWQMNVEVNLLDKNSNSLKQLNKYIDAMSVIAQKKKELNNYPDFSVVPVDSIAPQVDTIAVKP